MYSLERLRYQEELEKGEKFFSGEGEFSSPNLVPGKVKKLLRATGERTSAVLAGDAFPLDEKAENKPHHEGKASSKTAKGRAERVAEETPLVLYKTHYERWPVKAKKLCEWNEVEKRLLAQDGYYLRLAGAMNKGGVLFGVDKEGNPLVADGGLDPVMKGKNWYETRDEIEMKSKEYEMFPCKELKKGEEMVAFESFTGEPFVKSHKRRSASWIGGYYKMIALGLTFVGRAQFDPKTGRVELFESWPDSSEPDRGVRRLLRLRKPSQPKTANI